MADRVITTEPIALVCADGGVCGVNGTATHGTYAFVYIGESGAVVHCESGMVNPTADVPRVTNNVSELVAILRALRSLPDGWSGTVYSDSENALGRVFRGVGAGRRARVLCELLAQSAARLGAVEYVLLDGHPTRKQLEEGIGKRGHPVSKHNVTCDRLCNEARAVWEKEKRQYVPSHCRRPFRRACFQVNQFSKDFLTVNETRAWRRYRGSGDKAALEFLLNKHDPLVWAVVERTYRLLPLEKRQTIYQYGKVGLFKAIQAFDPARGTAFGTVAWDYIRNEALQGAREVDYLTSHHRNEMRKVKSAVASLKNEGDETPSVPAIAARAKMSPARVETVRALPTTDAIPFSAFNLKDYQIDQIVMNKPDRTTVAMPLPQTPLPENVRMAFLALPTRSRVMVYRHICRDETFVDIGQSYGITRQGAQNVIDRALKNVRLAVAA